MGPLVSIHVKKINVDVKVVDKYIDCQILSMFLQHTPGTVEYFVCSLWMWSCTWCVFGWRDRQTLHAASLIWYESIFFIIGHNLSSLVKANHDKRWYLWITVSIDINNNRCGVPYRWVTVQGVTCVELTNRRTLLHMAPVHVISSATFVWYRENFQFD